MKKIPYLFNIILLTYIRNFARIFLNGIGAVSKGCVDFENFEARNKRFDISELISVFNLSN